jgi:hypothetical protein
VTDWIDWHSAYDDPASPLAQRLAVVQELLGEAIASHAGTHLRVLGICAGDGRDVLPVLARWKAHMEVTGRLIELRPPLAERARLAARREGLDGVEVVCGDASSPSNLSGAIPADVIVLCGVFGNISDDDVEGLVSTLPAMCAEGASVVWTRHRREPDLTPRLRDWFALHGFRERAFSSPGPGSYSVGVHELAAPPRRASLPDPLFTFVR